MDINKYAELVRYGTTKEIEKLKEHHLAKVYNISDEEALQLFTFLVMARGFTKTTSEWVDTVFPALDIETRFMICSMITLAIKDTIKELSDK